MEDVRLNQLLQENPGYLEEFSNDIFNHFTENLDFKAIRFIEGYSNAEKLFREDIERHDRDSSILSGAFVQVYKSFNEDYRRRGGESVQLFTHAEKIDTQEFLKRFKETISEQVAYYSDPKHQNNMFTKYYVDNILPSNETSLAKTLTNIDKADKTIKLAETTSMERENAKREHEIHEQKEKELHEKLFGNGSRSEQKTQEERTDSKTETQSLSDPPPFSAAYRDRQIEIAKKAGYIQGVCECVAAIGDDHTLGKKLLSEMNVTKDMAKKFANPETYKTLEQGIFAQQQKIEQTHSIKR